MKCSKCGGKGFIETKIMRDARPDGQGKLDQCCDISAYSAEVARRMNPETNEQVAKRLLGHGSAGVVLEFKRRST